MVLELDEIDRLTSEAYDLVGSRYHELFKDELKGKKYDLDLLDRFAESFSSGAIVYDLGCGPSGHVGKYLHDKGVHVVGVDISERCVAMAAEHNIGMEFHRMRMTELALDTESIDGILSYYSIIHTPKRFLGRIFQEFRRVLKEGGLLLVAVKQGDSEGLVDVFLDLPASIWITNFRQQEEEDLLMSNGFRILTLEVRDPYPDEIQISRIYALAEKTGSCPRRIGMPKD